MSLLTIARADTAAILADTVCGVGETITLTAPDGSTGTLTGWSNDIGLFVDPDTGQAVSGRIASIAIPISALTAESLAIPENIPDAGSRPWLVETRGNTFKVIETHPDQTLQVVTCTLEAYSSGGG